MKILLATSAAIPTGGGIASYNQELVKSLGSGDEIDLLTAANEKNVDGYCITKSLYSDNIYDFNIAKQLITGINESHYDLIINSDSEFVAISAPFLSSPIISVAHFVDGILADCAGYNNKYVNAIIALSNYGKKYLVHKFHILDKTKVKVVYNFVHPKDFHINKTNKSPLVIVYPGGTSIKKSVDVVMDVAFRLKRTDLSFSFYWIGEDILPSSNYSVFGVKSIKQMIHGDARFVLTGKVPREVAEDIIAQANIFLLPSRGEGCPMTLLEAMRTGCIPIVSDAHHGGFELIYKSKAGLVVKQNDSKATFKLLADIIKNHDKYKGYYTRSKKYSETALNSEVWTSIMNKIILETVSLPRANMVLSEDSYIKSVKGYIKLKKQDRRNNMISSALNRIKMDWLYLKWQGWK